MLKYSTILLIASSYKLYSLVSAHTEQVLNNEAVTNISLYLIPRFFDFLILASFISITTQGRKIHNDILGNTLQIKLSSFGSIKIYFFKYILQNFYLSFKLLLPSISIIFFIMLFTYLDILQLISSILGLILVVCIEAIIFSMISIFKNVRYLSFITFIIIYYFFSSYIVQDYLYAIINLKLLFFMLSILLLSIGISDKLIMWSIRD